MNMKFDFESAEKSLEGLVSRTPTLFSADLTERIGSDVYLKPENLQVTGSFKIRGAANRMVTLTEEEKARGVITASSGNHGKAVAYMASRMSIPATICVPGWIDPLKYKDMEANGARILLIGETYDEADRQAHELKKRESLTFIHPFDDPLVIAGQGTVGLEVIRDIPNLSEILIPLSGGGLAGGIACAIKTAGSIAMVTAVSADQATVMLESIKSGGPVEMKDNNTLASALLGGIGLDNRYSFNLVRNYVDRHLTVSEKDIAMAMDYAARELHMVVEGGGAVALAAILTKDWNSENPGKPIAIVLSGGNVSSDYFMM